MSPHRSVDGRLPGAASPRGGGADAGGCRRSRLLENSALCGKGSAGNRRSSTPAYERSGPAVPGCTRHTGVVIGARPSPRGEAAAAMRDRRGAMAAGGSGANAPTIDRRAHGGNPRFSSGSRSDANQKGAVQRSSRRQETRLQSWRYLYRKLYGVMHARDRIGRSAK